MEFTTEDTEEHRGNCCPSVVLCALCGEDFDYRPNCTVTRDPAGMCVPAGGDCCRATPLPTGSSSRPASCAASSALRTVLPTNDGTTIPPCSTSRTTVPVVGSFIFSALAASLVFAGTSFATGGAALTETCSRMAACTTFSSAPAFVGGSPFDSRSGRARATLGGFAPSEESALASAVSSGSPG